MVLSASGCGSPSSLCDQSFVSASVAMTTCSEQSGSSVTTSSPRSPVTELVYTRTTPPATVYSGLRIQLSVIVTVCSSSTRCKGPAVHR